VFFKIRPEEWDDTRPHFAPLPRLNANRARHQRRRLWQGTSFDPDLDWKRDWQGLWQFTDGNRRLRDGVRAYAGLRDDDSPDIRGMI